MPRANPKIVDFSRALQTKSQEDGQPLNDFRVFANARVDKRGVRRRKGKTNLGQVADDHVAATPSGTEYYRVTADTRVWCPFLKFTIEALIKPTSISGTPSAIYAGHTTPSFNLDIASNKWRARLWNAAGAATTLTSTSDASTATADAIQFTRDGDALSLKINNVEEATGTFGASTAVRSPVGYLHVMNGAATDYMDGGVSYVRVFSITKGTHKDRLLVYPDPRAKHVMCDIYCRSGKTGNLYDRSRFENHMLEAAAATPGSETAYTHASGAVQKIEAFVTRDGKKRIAIVSNGRVRSAEV